MNNNNKMEELFAKLMASSKATLHPSRSPHLNDPNKLELHKQELNNEETRMREVADEIKKRGSYQRPIRNIYSIENSFKQKREKLTAPYEQGRFIFQTNYITTQRHTSLHFDLSKLKVKSISNALAECKYIFILFYSQLTSIKWWWTKSTWAPTLSANQ